MSTNDLDVQEFATFDDRFNDSHSLKAFLCAKDVDVSFTLQRVGSELAHDAKLNCGTLHAKEFTCDSPLEKMDVASSILPDLIAVEASESIAFEHSSDGLSSPKEADSQIENEEQHASIPSECIMHQETEKLEEAKPTQDDGSPCWADGGWECPSCTLHNSAEVVLCSLCAARRPMPPDAENGANDGVGSSSEEWSCTWCTFINTTASLRCCMCRGPRECEKDKSVISTSPPAPAVRPDPGEASLNRPSPAAVINDSPVFRQHDDDALKVDAVSEMRSPQHEDSCSSDTHLSGPPDSNPGERDGPCSGANDSTVIPQPITAPETALPAQHLHCQGCTTPPEPQGVGNHAAESLNPPDATAGLHVSEATIVGPARSAIAAMSAAVHNILDSSNSPSRPRASSTSCTTANPSDAASALKAAEQQPKKKTFSSQLEKLLKRPKGKGDDIVPQHPQAQHPETDQQESKQKPGNQADAAKSLRSLGNLLTSKFSKFGQQSPQLAPQVQKPGQSPPAANAGASPVLQPLFGKSSSQSPTRNTHATPSFTIQTTPTGGFIFTPVPNGSHTAPSLSTSEAPAGGGSSPPWLSSVSFERPATLAPVPPNFFAPPMNWGYSYHRYSRHHEEDEHISTPEVVEIIPNSSGSVCAYASHWAVHKPPEVRHLRRGFSATYLISTVDSSAFRQTFGDAVQKHFRHSHRHWRSSPSTLEHSAAMWAAMSGGSELGMSWRKMIGRHPYSMSSGEEDWRDRHHRSREDEREREMALAALTARAHELSRNRHHQEKEKSKEKDKEKEKDGHDKEHDKERSLLKFMEDGTWASSGRASKIGRFFFGNKDEESSADSERKVSNKRQNGVGPRHESGSSHSKQEAIAFDIHSCKVSRSSVSCSPPNAASSSSSSTTGIVSPRLGGQLANLRNTFTWRRLGNKDNPQDGVQVEDNDVH